MLLVVAGSGKQAHQYASKKGLQVGQWRYVSSVDNIRQYKEPEFALVGTYYDRRDWTSIMRHLTFVGGRQVDRDDE